MSLTREQIAMRKKWVKALRSGKYEQTRHMLRGVNGFCCLGVACDVVNPSQWSEDTNREYVLYGANDTEMPSSVGWEVGLSLNDTAALVDMNDVNKDNFDTIADAIELITLADMED